MRLVATSHVSLALLFLSCTSAEDQHKRVPSGFTGVRGKKSIPDSAYSDVSESENTLKTYDSSVSDGSSDSFVAEKRAPSGFMGMRGKKPSPAYVLPWEGTYPDALYKRAPSGFMGMRGKKDSDLNGYEDKRAPSGFFGMRGKKLIGYHPYQQTNYYDEKRAPMGFVGMRGKKDFEETSYMDGKRAPSGFFGMRGKKQPSGFFGMRGKKYPYEFRGKFIGVRGKKTSNEINAPDYYSDVVDLNRLGEELDINQLMLLLTEQNEAERNWKADHSNDGFSSQ